MKTRKIFAVLSAVVLALSLNAFAQQGPADQGGDNQQRGEHHGPPSADDLMKMLTERLSLSADQQAKIKPIVADMLKQMGALHQDESLSREEKMQKMRSLHDAARAKVRALLNDDQKKKFDEMQQEHRQHMQEREQHEQNQQQ